LPADGWLEDIARRVNEDMPEHVSSRVTVLTDDQVPSPAMSRSVRDRLADRAAIKRLDASLRTLYDRHPEWQRPEACSILNGATRQLAVLELILCGLPIHQRRDWRPLGDYILKATLRQTGADKVTRRGEPIRFTVACCQQAGHNVTAQAMARRYQRSAAKSAISIRDRMSL
jgi:hypothetical protein